MICIYDSKETNFNNNGLVVLNECKSFYTTEKLNGEYEVEFEYPLDNKGKWKYILENNIVKNSEGQLFRIYYKNKTLSGIKANARHIFYDLLDNFLEDVRPTEIGGANALDWILTRTQYTHSFKSTGDVGGSGTRYFIRKNVVEAILGKEGIINTWGGEIVRDNFTIKLLQARGLDRGALVAYGKNIQGIEETLDIDGICTRLMPKGKDGLLLSEKYIDSPYINNFPHPKIKMVEFSDIEDEETLRSVATEYMISNKIDIPIANYKVDFIELSKTVEYKNYAILERVYEGDIVTIRHSKLGMDLKAKVISIKKNDLTKRIEKIELGSFKPNLATTINNSIQEVKKEIEQSTTFLEEAINNATNLINNALGGYVVKRNGELLIMDTEDIMTATKVWRWNQGGLGYSNKGYNGPYETAITQDGGIVANFITTGILNAALIKTGLLQSENGASWLNMNDGTFKFGEKLMFDGIKLISKTSNGIRAIELNDTNIHFYDWEHEGRNLGIIYSSKLVDYPDVRGFSLSHRKNAFMTIGYEDVATGSYGSYIILDKEGNNPSYAAPIRVLEGTVFSEVVNMQNRVYIPRLLCFDKEYTSTTPQIFKNANDARNILCVQVSVDAKDDGFIIKTNTESTLFGILAGYAYPIYANTNMQVNGNFTVTGSKNSLQKTKSYGERLINAYETAEYYFGDIGSGIIKNGECIVWIDDILQECINTDVEYHVFTQLYNGAITKIERHKNYFIVYGEDNTEFTWELKAKRIGYENVRLDNPNIEGYLDNSPVFTDEDLKNDTSEDILIQELDFKLEDILIEEVA